MVKKGYGALIIGANSSCSNLNFFKKGDYPYNLRTFAPSSGNYKLITPLKANTYYYSSCFFSPVGLLLSAVERRSRLRIFSGQTRCR